MSEETTASDYLPKDYLDSFTKKYNAYQERYAEEPRESDKILISIIEEVAASNGGGHLSLLDIGCSTGNLLFHIKRALPHLDLMGGDLAVKAIEQCRANPRLEGIKFEVIDIFDIKGEAELDIIVANAVSVYFSNEDYERAIESISRALKPGGWFLAFEWLHPFNQDIQIIEKSNSHPDGLKFHFRPYAVVEQIMRRHDFRSVEFRPFQIPIDLGKNRTYSDNKDGFEDLNTYTLKTENGQRLLFRGTLYQPWCHLLGQK